MGCLDCCPVAVDYFRSLPMERPRGTEASSAQSHEWGPPRRQLAEGLDQKVGIWALSVRNQLWQPPVLEQWAAALRTPSMQRAHMKCIGPHTHGTDFIRHVIEESITLWYAHTKVRAMLPKACLGRKSMRAWVLQEPLFE